jgi:hypothetical protein
MVVRTISISLRTPFTIIQSGIYGDAESKDLRNGMLYRCVSLISMALRDSANIDTRECGCKFPGRR